MKVSCLLVSHNKPQHVSQAVQSILLQTYKNWELILMDSGVLYDRGFFDVKDERIKIYKTGETEEMKETTAMAPWCFNECFRRKLITGDLVVYLCDDDIFYENAFETFVDFATKHPEVETMYAGQDQAIFIGNNPVNFNTKKATEILGNGISLDYKVDSGQFCHRTSAMDCLWPEGRDTEAHADGVFMDRICKNRECHPIPVKVSQNRKTEGSTYYPVSQFEIVSMEPDGNGGYIVTARNPNEPSKGNA